MAVRDGLESDECDANDHSGPLWQRISPLCCRNPATNPAPQQRSSAFVMFLRRAYGSSM